MTATRIRTSKATRVVTLFLGLLLSTATTTAAAPVPADYKKEHSIPTFSVSELQELSTYVTAIGSGDNDQDKGHDKDHDHDRADDFRKALSTNGLLAVLLDDDDINEDWFYGYANDRKIALDGLCSCIDHPGFLKLDQTHELTPMDSSTARTSVATATVGLDHPLPLPEGMEATCGNEVLRAMEALRDTVASVSRSFVAALDQSLVNVQKRGSGSGSNHGSQQPLLRDEFGTSYNSVADIVKVANHLEHFHVYTNNNNHQAEDDNFEKNSNSTKTTDVAWDWHTDAGLFLVFVPAWDCNSDYHGNNVDDSFYYRDTDGASVRAKFDGGRTAIVMLGQGAQDWLDLPPPKRQKQQQQKQQQQSLLKATTHSVRWSEQSQSQPSGHLTKQRRAWYGMMNLVPETALIYGGKSLRDVKQSLSLSHLHKTDYQPPSGSSSTSGGGSMSLGCGGVAASPQEDQSEGRFFELEEVGTTERRQRHLQMQDASMCNNVTNFFCWMTCMDIPKVDQAPLYLEAGYSLYCVDKSIMRSSGNLATAHNACIGVHNIGCMGEWEKIVDGVPAVEIDIVAMESSDEIEIPFCYSGTTMYMEGFQWIQSSTCVVLLFPSWVLNSASKYALAMVGTILTAIGLEKFIQQRRKAMASMEGGTSRLAASAAFYGVQLSIGYVLMLIIMIYSGLLFLSVILGLVVGHVMFNARDAIWPIHESPHLNIDDEEEVYVDNRNNANNHGVEAAIPMKKSSCCITPTDIQGHTVFTSTNLLLEKQSGSESALREGGAHCQEFESNNDGHEYYGSMENGNNGKAPAIVTTNKKSKRKKTFDQGVPEGSTPCCQHGS
jgi:hypothetical protein